MIEVWTQGPVTPIWDMSLAVSNPPMAIGCAGPIGR